MKVFNLFASIAFTTLSIRSAYGSSACAEVSYLYYSQSCCDQADTTCYNIVESTDNATMGNLVGLKRENGAACADDDVVTYVDDTGTGSHGLACVGTGSTAPPLLVARAPRLPCWWRRRLCSDMERLC